MKNSIFVAFATILCLVSACNQSDIQQNVTFQIEPQKGVDYNKVISRIELIPLDTNSLAYMSELHRCHIYDNHILFHDKNDILYLFDKKGKFISNSRKRFGEGPEDYSLCFSASYNEYSNQIEVLTPVGMITYDSLFNYTQTLSYAFPGRDNSKEIINFDYLYDVSDSQHLLFPKGNSSSSNKILLYDSKRKQFIDKIEYNIQEEGITMQEEYVSNRSFVAFPYINYTFYEMDYSKFELNKLFTISFGDKGLTNKDIKNLPNTVEERRRYLALECTKYIPTRSFLSGKYLFSLVKEGPLLSDFQMLLFNVANERAVWLDMQYDNIQFPIIEKFENNIMYGIITNGEVSKYVDTSLLDDKSRDVFKELSDDSNYSIVKYYISDEVLN